MITLITAITLPIIVWIMFIKEDEDQNEMNKYN